MKIVDLGKYKNESIYLYYNENVQYLFYKNKYYVFHKCLLDEVFDVKLASRILLVYKGSKTLKINIDVPLEDQNDSSEDETESESESESESETEDENNLTEDDIRIIEERMKNKSNIYYYYQNINEYVKNVKI